jgi:L-lactate dehydrogenase complex protein LldG
MKTMASTSREQILEKMRQNKPTDAPELPENIQFPPFFDDPELKFCDTLAGIGGQAIFAPSYAFIAEDLQQLFPAAQLVVHAIDDLPLPGVHPDTMLDDHDLAPVDLAILPGALGVAENGAIWLDERHFGRHRVLPFITQHLVIVLDRKKITHNLHAAYGLIDPTATGFGMWLAGPSKTADIEQSLVIGAHGARSLRVYLLG